MMKHTKVDFYAKESHHLEHARAIYDKMPEKYKGDLFVNELSVQNSPNQYVLVCSFGDLKRVNKYKKKVIFCEHGVGQYYNVVHGSYAGSTIGRENVILRLSPNEIHASKERKTIPHIPVEVVGVPKMDQYASLRDSFVKSKIWQKKEDPTVAISFHWDCVVVAETRSSFNHFQPILADLASEVKLIGHGHPRIIDRIRPVYQRNGITVNRVWDKVIREAELYVCDNSSTIFEFAYMRKPIVLLNSPLYRKDITHEGNTRFWKHSNIGPQVDKPEDLLNAIYDAWDNFEDYLPKIDAAAKEIFTYLDGKCGERAAKAIIKAVESENAKRV